MPGLENVELFEMSFMESASLASCPNRQRLVSKRVPSLDHLISSLDPKLIAQIAAWKIKRNPGELTKEDLKPLLDQGLDYDTVQHLARADYATFCGVLRNMSRTERKVEGVEQPSEDEDGVEDYEDDDTESDEKQDTPSGSSQSEQLSTIIDTPPGSSQSEGTSTIMNTPPGSSQSTSTARHLTPDSTDSAFDTISLVDQNPWAMDDKLADAPQQDENAQPSEPSPPQTQDRTSESDRDAWRVSPRMAKIDQARNGTAKDVLGAVSAKHFERDFKLALYFDRGTLADEMTILWHDMSKAFVENHESDGKINDPKQLRFAPKTAISVAVEFAQTRLGPYMVNHVVPQPDLAFFADDAIQCAWTSVYRRAWGTDAVQAVGQFVDDVLEKFMKLGEELDLD